MTTSHGETQQSFTEQVAAEIRAVMGRKAVRQSELARRIDVTDQWLSVRLRGTQPIDLNDLAMIAAGLGVSVAALLPESIGEILDVEVIRSRPMRSKPARHSRTVTKITGEYSRRPERPRPARPNTRPPNRRAPAGPNGPIPKQAPTPTTRRPARIPSPAVNPNGPLRSRSGAATDDLRPMSSIMPTSAGSPS